MMSETVESKKGEIPEDHQETQEQTNVESDHEEEEEEESGNDEEDYQVHD